MKYERSEDLYRATPNFFCAYKRAGKTCPLSERGFECGDGWYEILRGVSAKIEALDPSGKVWAVQVKQKFGVLEIYLSSGHPEIEALLRQVREVSASTCEVCGAPGKLHRGSWYHVACDRCAYRALSSSRKDARPRALERAPMGRPKRSDRCVDFDRGCVCTNRLPRY